MVADRGRAGGRFSAMAHNNLDANVNYIMPKLKYALSRILPDPMLRGLRTIRDISPSGNAWRHIQAERISFMSGLGDSSNLLYGIVRSMKPSVCLEIGSARGRSTCYIAMALKENGRGTLYAVDPHTETEWNDHSSRDTYEILQQNLETLDLSAQVQVLREFSEEVARSWESPIDLLFIDGDHSYEGVKRDWELFVRHLSPFGVAIFHDTTWDLHPDPNQPRLTQMGVPRFVEELRKVGYPVLTIDKDCGISLVQRVIGGIPLRLESDAHEHS